MPDEPAGLDPEDFYFEGPYLVFTAGYLLKRGYCCSSGCRHCPYRNQDIAEQQETAPQGTGAQPRTDARREEDTATSAQDRDLRGG